MQLNGIRKNDEINFQFAYVRTRILSYTYYILRYYPQSLVSRKKDLIIGNLICAEKQQ